MKITYRKNMAWVLAAVLAAGFLGGCQKSPDQGGGEMASAGQGETGGAYENRGQTLQDKDGDKAPGAMGRYEETKVVLPQEAEGQSFIQLEYGINGNIELFTADRDQATGDVREVFRYEYGDGEWERDETWTGNDVLREGEIDLNYVTLGMDGRYYMGGTDQDYVYHLFRLEEGGSEELLSEAFKPEEGRDYGLLPAKFEILENENILIYGYSEGFLYEPDGRLLFTMTKDFSGSTDDARGFCEGSEFVTVLDDRLVRYDLRDGKVTETIELGEVTGGRLGLELSGDGAGGVYCASETGLSHINKGGTLWEILIDGSLNHMGMRSLYLKKFLPGGADDYYGVFVSEGGRGIQMFRYEYNPELASVPPTGLTVYALRDHSTVRQAVSLFQSLHPEVKVEFRTAVEENGTVTEEMIQGLNTELLGGKGADVLILDGLPVKSYIEKGILMDLSDVVEELESSGEMFDNLLEGFRREDGTIYQIPARAAFPLVLGREEAVKAYDSLGSIAEYQGEKPLIARDLYENLLRKIGYLCYEELFGEGENIKNREVLVAYLKAVKAIGESNGSKTAFSQEEMEKYRVSNYTSPTGFVRDSVEYDMGNCDSGTDLLDGYWSVCIPAEVRNRQPGTVMEPAGKVYLPSTMAGINQSAANEETAREFIRCLLSYDVQKEELYDGFPVSRKALEAWADKDMEGYSIGTGFPDSDYHLTAGWPAENVRQEINAMLETLTVPAVADETVMTMVVEGSRDFLDGNETADQAADKILRKLAIYLAE